MGAVAARHYRDHDRRAGDAPLSEDTAPEIERRQLEVFRSMSAAQKVAIVHSAFEQSRRLAFAGLRRRHPDADERELMRRFVQLVHGDELARRADRWDPTSRGSDLEP